MSLAVKLWILLSLLTFVLPLAAILFEWYGSFMGKLIKSTCVIWTISTLGAIIFVLFV